MGSEFDLTPAEVTIEPWETSRISAITRSKLEFPLNVRGLDADDLAAIEALPPGSALLIAQTGPDAGARYLLNTDRVVAGRKPSNDIFLDDVTVSRSHAEFVRSPEGFTVRDLTSLNGTYVNQNLVDVEVLHTGDEVRIGKFRFTFYMNR